MRNLRITFSVLLFALLLQGCGKKESEGPNYTTGICKSRNWHLITKKELTGPWLDTDKDIDTTYTITRVNNKTINVFGNELQWNNSNNGIVHFSASKSEKYAQSDYLLDYYLYADSIRYFYSLHVMDRTTNETYLFSLK